jgi:hypothetical protein
MLRQIHAVTPPAPRQPPQPEKPPARPPLPAALLARARELDARHRDATGRPISRDNLRAALRIGRDKAGALTAAVRAEPQAQVKELVPHPPPRPVTRPAMASR